MARAREATAEEPPAQQLILSGTTGVSFRIDGGGWAMPKDVRLRICSTVTVSALALLLAGCQSPSGTTSEPVSAPVAESAPSSTPALTPTPTPTPSVTSVAAPTGYQPFGHFLYKPLFDQGDLPRVDGQASLYVIGTGEVALVGKTLLPGKDVQRETYTSIGTKDKPLVAAAFQVRQPAKGLDPEKYVWSIAVIDPTTRTIVKSTDVLSSDTKEVKIDGLTGSPNGSAVAYAVEGTTNTLADMKATGFDTMAGAKLWEKPGYLEGPVLGAVVLKTEGATKVNGAACPVFTGTEIATGKVLYTLDAGTVPDTRDCGRTDVSSSGSYSGRAEMFKYIRIHGWSADYSFEALTGKPVTLPHEVTGADPRSSLVFPVQIGPMNSSSAQPFGVLDTATGKPAWVLDDAKAKQLQVTLRSIYNHKAYLKTTDQQPVVDLDTGKTISDNDPRYPVGAVDDWTYWSDGVLDKTP